MNKAIGLFILTTCFALTACEDDITVEVRSAVAEAGGLQQAHDMLLERARAGDGRDVYVFRMLVLMYVPSEGALDPNAVYANWPFTSDADRSALLNCSAEAGYLEARRIAPLEGEEATNTRACLKAYGIRKPDAWTHCGADRLMPECPLF